MAKTGRRLLRFPAVSVAASLALAGGGLANAAAAQPAAAPSPWINVPVPHSLANAELSDAALASPLQGWAVGEQGAGESPDQPVIWQWTGTGWAQQNVQLPARGNLIAVAADPGHAWVAGQDYSQPGPATGLNLYWNGTSWQRAASQAYLFGLAAVGGGQAWAVGLTGSDHQTSSILRWTGTDWAVASNRPSLASLRIAATSASNVWVSGFNVNNGRTVLLHYNGSAWRRVTAPPGIAAESIAAGAPDDVWVAGLPGVAARAKIF